MNLLYLCLFFQSVFSDCCLNCTSTTYELFNTSESNCSICKPPYSLYKFTCVQNCGYGYSPTNNTCTANGQILSFIQTYFNTVNDYTLNRVGQFKTKDESSFAKEGNFMPTVDRGFYSDSFSNLVGLNSWIPTTDFSLQFYF